MVEAGQGETSGGYITFVLNQRHLAPDKLESAAWAMLSFFPLVLYHVKCCKLAMHTSMRRRVDSMMQVLRVSPPSAPHTPFPFVSFHQYDYHHTPWVH